MKLVGYIVPPTGPRFGCFIHSDLITEENQQIWIDYLRHLLENAVNKEAMNTPLFKEVVAYHKRIEEWEATREQREAEEYETKLRRKPLDKQRINFIPEGESVDYEKVYAEYLDKIIAFHPETEDDCQHLLNYYERWVKKSIPQILKLNRPDAAYAIAIEVCRHLPQFLQKEDMQEYFKKKQPRLRKFIRLSFEALVDTVKLLGDEEKQQYVVDFIKQQAPFYSSSKRLQKDILAMI